MERLISGEWNIFRTILCILDIGLMKCGRASWQEAEATRKDFNIVLTRQDKKFFISELFKGHSGRNPIDPTLQHNVLILDNFFEYIYHIGCAINFHSITNSGLIAGGQNSSRERQTVFCTVVNPMDKDHKDPYELDLTKPRLASYKHKKWQRHQDTVYWVDCQLAQRKGLKFYQTRCNAIILYDTLLAYCISKVVVMESGEIIYEKVSVSPRPPPKFSYTNNWMCELDSNVVGSSKDTQRIQPKPKTQLSRTVTPVRRQESTLEIEKDILFGHEDIKHSTRTERPVDGSKSIQSCVSMLIKIEEEDQTRTVRRQESTKVEELDIDFRILGLPHSVVNQAENSRVHELVKKIENHPHRHALQRDLQQNKARNPFSTTTKKNDSGPGQRGAV